MQYPRQRAFSIIEVLTVITIVGILASILIPVMGSMRSSARTTQCTGNLRQLGAAFALYMEENNHYLPAVGNSLTTDPLYWPVALHKYTGAPFPMDGGQPHEETMNPVFSCPDWEFVRENETFPNIGYAYATSFEGGGPVWARKAPLSSLRDASRTILVAEHSHYYFHSKAADGGALLQETSGKGVLRHQTQSNYLFADGHVESLAPEQARAYFP